MKILQLKEEEYCGWCGVQGTGGGDLKVTHFQLGTKKDSGAKN